MISLRVWLFLKFFLNPRYRSEKITRNKYPDEMIQTSSATRMNRYPHLFEIASKELKEIPHPKILSFGCSTGEELLSIKEYISKAEIVGVDINHRAISIAKKRDPSGAFHYFHSLDEAWKIEASFDCIFALAVFQKSEHRDQNQKIALDSFTFNKFEEMVGQLDSMLKKKGLLIIEHSDYAFQDLKISQNYSVSENDRPRRRERPIFSKENIKDTLSHESHCIFIKDSD
jgi:methylase of polypeptide subunit release factors